MAIMWSPSTMRAGVVDGDQPVGVAVEGQPDVGTVGSRRLRPTTDGNVAPHASLMLRAVGRVVDHDDVGAEPLEHGAGDARRRAVGAVEDDTQTVEPTGPARSTTTCST